MQITFSVAELLGITSAILGAFGGIVGWLLVCTLRRLDEMSASVSRLSVRLAKIEGRLAIEDEGR